MDKLKKLFPNVQDYYQQNWLKQKNGSWDDFEYLIAKGHFPYEHLTNPDIFDETSLPPLSAFKSRLKNSNITKTQYKHAQKIWNKFEVKNKQDEVL